MGCSICRPASRLHFEETEDLNRPEDEAVYELCEDTPNLWITPTSFAQIRIAISKPNSIHASAYKKIQRYTTQIFVTDDLSKFKPYCGDDKDVFMEHAQATFNSMLYLALVGAVSSNSAYLSISKQILLSWAMTLPTPGTHLADNSHPARLLTATGLTISRFIDRIIESYRILAASMTTTEIFFVKRWLIALGATIKCSHEFWLEKYKVAGPQNHLSWHIFGTYIHFVLMYLKCYIFLTLLSRSVHNNCYRYDCHWYFYRRRRAAAVCITRRVCHYWGYVCIIKLL
jgi:hypothetical protein